jgi:endonuclease/exonuclease/phosphatase (EEP) superfamily protein YafD
VCCHAAWLAPDFLRDRRFDVPTETAASAIGDAPPTVRIFFANVAGDNTEYDALLQEIATANPDVVVLVEYTWGWHLAFKRAPEIAPYIHGSGHLQSHIGSVNVFSRLPLKSEMQSWISGRAVHTIEIALGSETLRIIGLHAPRPLGDPKYNYRSYWHEVLPLLIAPQGPLAIVGDFNATQHSLIYQQLQAGSLRSAHDAVGRGYATTWPNGKFPLPPIRIDQVFLSPEVECRSLKEGRGRGSDHKPLVVDIRIHRDRKAGSTASNGRAAPF